MIQARWSNSRGGAAHWQVAALLAGVLALIVLCRRFGFAEVAVACEALQPAVLLAAVACGCAARLGHTLRWRLVAHTLGAAPSLGRLLSARLAGDAIGSLLPTGRVSGDPLRVVLVAEQGGSTRAGAVVVIDRIIELLGNTLCGITSVTVFAFAHAFGASRAALLVGTLSLLLVLLVIPLEGLRRGMRPLEPIYRIVQRIGSARAARWLSVVREAESELMRFFRDHPARFVAGLCGTLCIEGLQIAEYGLLLAAFGLVLDLPTLLMTTVATGMARVVPTPAGLGAVEATQVAVQVVAGGGADVGFVVGVVMRMHETFWTVVGLLALSLRGFSLARLRTLLVERPAPV